MLTALASHQRGLGSNPTPDVIRGLSLLLVLVFRPRTFHRILQFSSLHKKPTLQILIPSEELCTKSHFVDIPLLNPIIIIFFVYSERYYYSRLSSMALNVNYLSKEYTYCDW